MKRRSWIAVPLLVCAAGCASPDPAEEPVTRTAERAPDPASYRAQWDRIAAWYQANAPEGAFALGAPASAADLEAAQQQLGRPLPAQVRAFYQAANGSQEAGVYGAFYVLALPALCEESAFWEQLEEGAWTRGAGWLPLTANGGGDHQVLDAEGRVFDFSHETGRETPGDPSILAWLQRFAGELEAGQWTWSEEDGQVVRRGE